MVVALALVPWPRLRAALAAASGLLLALLLLVKVLDLSFNAVFDRDFDPVGDWAYLGPGVGVLGDSIGAGWARAVAVLAGAGHAGGAGRRPAGDGAAGPASRRPAPARR